ncbi:retropepsin-like aspartic protease family protein [Comamonas sp. 4034]|uniref:retropepsin-like aspartic protease family protein n=1 Tax=Comamonas sp. 4034 TaxID=3156455 RepID=UPI003D1A6B01
MSRLRTQNPDPAPATPDANLSAEPPATASPPSAPWQAPSPASQSSAPPTPPPAWPPAYPPAAPPGAPRKSSPNGGPPAPTRRTTWLLLGGWAAVTLVIYLATDAYRKPAEGKVLAHGVLEIPRDRDGHFRVGGAVNGVPVQFMVDTGASIISITDKVAERAQLPEGVPMQFQTANGVREGTMRRAERIEVGPFAVNNLRVGTGYTGESDKDALLGQNFLRYFDVSMAGNTMVLRARETD